MPQGKTAIDIFTERIFPLACVQTGSTGHPASYPRFFLGGKERPGREADNSPPSNAEVKSEELYFLPLGACMA
jgi:hypothetical protein